jgi:citrate synthase
VAGLSESSGDRITIHGHDLATELIGNVSFAAMVHLLTFGTVPEPKVESMINAILVTLADHGLTPSAVAARLTYHGAPDSIQGAVAAGLLGAGPALLGTTEQAAVMLSHLVRDSTPETREQLVSERVSAWVEGGTPIPGFGHPIHRDGDDRVAALRRIQVAEGIPDEHYLTAVAVGEALGRIKGRRLPMNAAGAIGAIVCDMGLPPRFARGLSIVARSAGLVAHVAEEEDHPIAGEIWANVRSRALGEG